MVLGGVSRAVVGIVGIRGRLELTAMVVGGVSRAVVGIVVVDVRIDGAVDSGGGVGYRGRRREGGYSSSHDSQASSPWSGT